MNASLRVIAPAKLNLFLHVTGKRDDGYHLLQSLVAFTGFGDVIELTTANTVELRVEGAYAAAITGSPDTNLVMLAASLLKSYSGYRGGASITLYKEIPVGAGLGGGSSDAASVLRGLATLWQLPVSHAQLHELALQLGSDVPVCLSGRTAWMAGTGDQVSPVTGVHAWVLLVNPGVSLLTAAVFKALKTPYKAEMCPLYAIASPENLLDILQSTSNSLEVPAKTLLPVINEVLAALSATADCLISRMSGSGATCFGLYASQQAAEHAQQQIQRQHPAWWCVATALGETHEA